jgi:hypothetical protein
MRTSTAMAWWLGGWYPLTSEELDQVDAEARDAAERGQGGDQRLRAVQPTPAREKAG